MKKISKIIRESVDYLLISWPYILGISFLFFFATAIGFFFSDNFTFLDKIIQQIIDKSSDLEGVSIISFIFFNNILSAFYGLILGIFLGFLPIFSAFTNGLLLGYVMNKVVFIGGGFLDLLVLIPHGVFELPAIFIALGLGLKLGLSVFKVRSFKEIGYNILLSIVSFIIVILPLLFFAAIIEGTFINMNSVDNYVCFDKDCFSVELALTDSQLISGLSNRTSLENSSGMLFIFNESGNYNFWMKDMLFSLDIIWINESKNIVYIWENALPCSNECIGFSPESLAKYVLEIPAGSVKSLGLSVGDYANFSSSSKHLKLSITE